MTETKPQPTGPAGTGSEQAEPAVPARGRLRSGELGAWPVLIGLAIIWVTFQILNDRFLSAENLSNLTLQIAATTVMSVGIVLVLLLGEIDLSVGSVAGVCAAALAVLAVRNGVPEVLAIIMVLIFGALIGTLQGSIFAWLGVPAFIVTLAGNLGWLGLQLYLLGTRGTINIPFDGPIGRITHEYLSDVAGWVIGAVVIAIYAAATLVTMRRRRAVNLPALSTTWAVVRIVGLAAVIVVTVLVLNAYRGVPVVALVVIGLVALVDFVLRRTRYGRAIFALGGNIEAARRAGINVALIRVSVFALASTFAALGGILLTSRGFAAGQSTGGGELLLVVIAGAVIGGVSLFGGRGSTWGALLGALVLGSITSGLFLVQVDASVRFIVTALVLLAAVILDSVSRRERAASGRG